jgi:hypothetical protein
MVALPGVNRALAATLPATPAAPAVTSGSGGGVHPDTASSTNGDTTLYVNGDNWTVNYSTVTQNGPCGPWVGAFEEAKLANGATFEAKDGPYYEGWVCYPSLSYLFPGFYSGMNTNLYGSFLNGNYWTNPASVYIYARIY